MRSEWGGAMARAPGRRGNASLSSHVLITALLAAILVQAANIFDVFWPGATYFAYLVQALIFLIYLVFPMTRIRLAVMLPAFGTILFLVIEHIRFCHIAERPYNFNALLFYLPLLSFVPLYKSGLPASRITSILFVLSTIYVAVYVVAHDLILSGGLGDNRAIRNGDFERGARLYLAAGFATFMAFYTITNRRMAFLLRVAIFALAVAAVWLSGFRTLGSIFIVIMLLYSLRLLGTPTRIALFGVFLAISGGLLLGLIIPQWNPFQSMSSDGSAFARALEYDVAMKVIKEHLILGVGIASDFEAQQAVFRTREYEPLYPTDLGILGPFIHFGIVGVVAFLIITYVCMVPMPGKNDGSGFRGLQLNGLLCGLMGVISPSLLLDPNALFLSILLVARLREGPLVRPIRFERVWFEALPQRYGLALASLRSLFRRRSTHDQIATHYSPPDSRSR